MHREAGRVGDLDEIARPFEAEGGDAAEADIGSRRQRYEAGEAKKSPDDGLTRRSLHGHLHLAGIRCARSGKVARHPIAPRRPFL